MFAQSWAARRTRSGARTAAACTPAAPAPPASRGTTREYTHASGTAIQPTDYMYGVTRHSAFLYSGTIRTHIQLQLQHLRGVHFYFVEHRSWAASLKLARFKLSFKKY